MPSVLPNASDCCETCDCPVVTNVPGSQGIAGPQGDPGIQGESGDAGAQGDPGPQGDPGNPGADGTNGINAFTVTTANFTQPAEGATVNVEVANSTWIAQDQHLYVTGGGDYQVTAIPDATHVTIRNLENTAGGLYPGNAAPAVVIASGADVSPGGIQGPSGSTGAAGTNSNAGSNAFSVHKNGTDQDQPSGGTGVQVTFAAALFDADAVFDLTSDEWTCPATGLYRFNLQIAYALKSGSAVAMECYARLYKNGNPSTGTLVGLNFFDSNAEAFDFYTITVDKVLSLTAGDTIQVNSFATYNDAGNVYEIDGTATETWLEGYRVA